MVRAAAKNYPSVAVITDPQDYDGVLAALRSGGFTLAERKRLAALAFRHTAEYDIAVASWMESALAAERSQLALPQWFAGAWRRSALLRYGENPISRRLSTAVPVPGRAWPRLISCTEKRCPTTTLLTRMQPGGRYSTTNRYAWRSSSTRIRAAWRSRRTRSPTRTARRMHATR